MTIPAGTRITGPDGNPLAQITITPVPIDRSPMPFPVGVKPPMLFSIQPGSAVPSQLLWTFDYGLNGNLLSVKDPAGNRISQTHDSMNRVIARPDALGGVERFAYDSMGNLVQKVDRNGRARAFAYDALNRQVTAQYADAVLNFHYDAAGRLVQASDSAGSKVSNVYDTLGRLTAETTALGTVTYVYDALGRRTGMSAPGDAPVSYGYDAASRLTQILQADRLVQLDHDAGGRRTRLTLPNGVVTEYQYDGASRLTAMTFRTATTTLGDLTYRYDAIGNRIGTGGSLADTLLPEAVTGAVYDQRNRQPAFGNRQNAFDANGNLTSVSDASGVRTLAWDGRDRLVRVDAPGLTATFTYDAFGRRSTRTVGAATTRHLHDGFDVVQEVTDGAPVTYLAGLGVDQPLVRNSAEYYLTDALGSVVGLATPGGSIGTRYLYTPFGEPRVDGAASANPFRFTAREFDAATGLYYFRARYLDPVASRFIQEDAAPGVGTLPQSLNRYSYAFNNPQTLVDHDGRFPGAAGLIGGLITGGIAGGIGGAIEGGISGGPSGAIAGGFFGAFAGTIAGGLAGLITQNLQLSTNTGALVGNLIGGALGELFNPSTLGRGPGDVEEVIKAPPSKPEPEFRRPPDEKPEPEFRRPPGDLSAPK